MRRRSVLRLLSAAAGCSATPLVLSDEAATPSEAVPNLELDEAELLAEQNGIRITRQRWRLQQEAGIAWRVSAPRQATVKVLPSPRIQPLMNVVPPSPPPWAAINGGFYDPDGKAMGAVVADSVTHSPFRRGGGSGVFQVTSRGVEIVHHSRFDRDATFALQSIDRIVANAHPLVNVRPSARASARSGIALNEREISLVLVAGDRSIVGRGDEVSLSVSSGYGMPLWGFSRYLIKALGAATALNLDGGVSAQLAADIGDRRFRVRNLRGTINAVLLRPGSKQH